MFFIILTYLIPYLQVGKAVIEMLKNRREVTQQQQQQQQKIKILRINQSNLAALFDRIIKLINNS